MKAMLVRGMAGRALGTTRALLLSGLAVVTAVGLVGCSSTNGSQSEGHTPGNEAANTGAAGAPSVDASSCTPKWTFSTLQKGVLSVAGVNNPPQLNIDPNTGKATGIDPDLLNKFAQLSCLTVKWNRLTGAAAVAGMSAGKMDVGAGGWGKTPERGKVMGQLNTVVYYVPTAILSNKGIDTIAKMAGKQIGVEGGSLYQTELQKIFSSSDVHVYQTVDAEVQDLVTGRIQAAFGDSIQMSTAAKTHNLPSSDLYPQKPDSKYPTLTAETRGNYPYTKGNTALGNALNQFIVEERASGDLKKIFLKWGLSEINVNGQF